MCEESEGSKRKTRRDGRRETRSAIRPCSRAKPAEGRGMTELWAAAHLGLGTQGTSTSSLGTWLGAPAQLAANPGGGAQGRYDGYIDPYPCPCPLGPCPIVKGTSAPPCTAQDSGSSQLEGILGQGRRRQGFLHQTGTYQRYIDTLVSWRAGLLFEVVTKQDTASSAGRRLMHGT